MIKSILFLSEILDPLASKMISLPPNKFTMKKLLAIAFIGGLIVTSCAKKEQATETNTMLEEPTVTASDTANAPSAPAAVPAAADSTMTK